MTVAHPAKSLGAPEPRRGEPSPDDDGGAPLTRHLTLVVSADATKMTASRRASMARHPSAAHRA